MSRDVIDNDLLVTGNANIVGNITPLRARTEILLQEALVSYPIPLTSFRQHDAMQTALTASPGSDDLGLIGAVFGTDCPYLSSGDLKNDLGVTTRYARVVFSLPAEYEAGQTVEIRISGGMKTTVASASATVAVGCYKSNRDGTKTGSDLNVTAAQSINSLTFADKDFIITATALAPGDELDIRVAIAINDTGTGTAVTGVIGAVSVLLDVRG